MANEVKIAVKVHDYTKAGFGSITKGLDGLKSNAAEAVAPIGKVGVTLLGVAAHAGTALKAVTAVGHGIAFVGSQLATMAPAAAVLAPLAAGFSLVKLAIGAMKPVLEDITKKINKDLSDAVTKLAKKDLKDLGESFMKINYPLIKQGVLDISESIFQVVQNVGKWTTSAEGVTVFKKIIEGTKKVMKDLEKPASDLAIAIGRLAGRAADPAFKNVSDFLKRAMNATTNWLNSLDSKKIKDAIDAVHGLIISFGKYIKVAKDVGKWMNDNKDKVKALSDAISVAAIAIGLATGNIGAVIGGTAAITANHWDTIKEKFGEGSEYIKGIWEKIKKDPNVQALWKSLKDSFKGFVDSFKKETKDIGEKFKELVEKLKEAWAEWGPIIKAWWDGYGKPILSALGHIFGWLATKLVEAAIIWMDNFTKMGKFIRKFVAVVLNLFSDIIQGAAIAFGWMPGIGPKLQNAASNFVKFRDRVNAALDGIEDENVKITVTTTYGGSAHSGEGYSTGIFSGGITGSGRKGMATGGITGAASGMVRGINMTRVNEQGQELARVPSGDIVSLPTGSTVIPHGQSQALLDRRRSPTNDTRVIIDLMGADEEFKRFFRAILRKNPNLVVVG